jgi:hypothetical protein
MCLFAVAVAVRSLLLALSTQVVVVVVGRSPLSTLTQAKR